MVHRRRGEEGIGRERRDEMVSELRSRWTSGDEVTGAGPASSRRAAASSRRRIESERDDCDCERREWSGIRVRDRGARGQHIYDHGGGGFVGWAACGLPH